MKIERTFRNKRIFSNQITKEKVISAEFSAQEILDIFKKTNKNTNFICHALYSHIKAKLAKKGNPLNCVGMRVDDVPEYFSYLNLAYYEVNVGDVPLTMSHQVMKWIQSQLGIDTNTIHPDLNYCNEFRRNYSKLDSHQARIEILEKIAAKDNVSNMKLVIFDI